MYYNEKQMIKVNHLSQYFPLFKDKTVVDIGCNAGVITERITKYAKKVYGIEKSKEILEEGKRLGLQGDAEYINLPIGEFLKKDYDFNSAYCSNALYYLTNAEITLIKCKLFPRCDLVMFVSYEPKPDLGNNSYNLGKWTNIESLLKENNFKTEVKNKDLKWVTTIGRK